MVVGPAADHIAGLNATRRRPARPFPNQVMVAARELEPMGLRPRPALPTRRVPKTQTRRAVGRRPRLRAPFGALFLARFRARFRGRTLLTARCRHLRCRANRPLNSLRHSRWRRDAVRAVRRLYLRRHGWRRRLFRPFPGQGRPGRVLTPLPVTGVGVGRRSLRSLSRLNRTTTRSTRYQTRGLVKHWLRRLVGLLDRAALGGTSRRTPTLPRGRPCWLGLPCWLGRLGGASPRIDHQQCRRRTPCQRRNHKE
ncbi:hypothetical protein CUTER_09820 [Corynebacterium uterequi]|uniref:Uncharacterized protein n=1 Tax=Corynebacterium uterequi TaxID=1072256 RepID=A0A0G3HLD0_9CORY|nr:hypothetical protein CUTER_09820 [Corynebacterium uterequi]